MKKTLLMVALALPISTLLPSCKKDVSAGSITSAPKAVTDNTLTANEDKFFPNQNLESYVKNEVLIQFNSCLLYTSRCV